MLGQRIGQYELVAKLGEGGMGVVYRALDTRLGRPVALKVVNEQLMREPDGHARLMREARMAAALNHPNICTIHEVIDLTAAEAAPDATTGAAIVFELVEGQTLAAKIAESGALPAKVLLDIAVQIADGLAAAHVRHIVHRDLKPQNVIITADGRVKILDFGLARLSSTATPDHDLSTRTDFDLSRQAGTEGATRGTVPYMSPEQAAGRPLDHRSDVFSFGIVLFEMAAGQRPFRGDKTVEILSKVLEAEAPDVTTVRADLPAALGRVVRRCLQKRAEERYQDTRDLLVDLREIQESLRTSATDVTLTTVVRHDTHGHHVTSAERRGGRMKWLAAIGIAAVATAIGVASMLMSQRGTATTSVAVHRQLTFVGDASLPTISPDGAFVAYVRGEPWGDFSATVAVPRATQRVVIHDLAAGGRGVEVAECRPCYAPTWSPDGRSLLLASEEGFSVIPRLGGTPRKFPSRGQAVWSPDGSEVAYAVSGGKAIGFITLETAQSRVVPLSWQYLWLRSIDWAPRGEVAVLTVNAAGHSAIWTVSPDGARQERIVEEPRVIRSIKWAPDAQALYYVRGGDADELVRIPVSATGQIEGDPTVVVSGLAMGPRFSVAKDGRSLLYTRELRYANLWSASLSSASAKAPVPITTGSSVDQFPSVSPKGDTIAFVRIAGGVSNVFTIPIAGGSPQQLSFLAATNGAPAWSPDGGSLAFCAASKDRHVLWTFELATNASRAFEATQCPTAGAETPVVWAPRREILYQRPGNRNYYLFNPESGTESPLIADEKLGWIFSPITSPDGTVIAAYWNRPVDATTRGRGIWLLSSTGAPAVRISDGFHWPLGWAADGQTMYVYVPDTAEIGAVPRRGGTLKVVGKLNAPRVGLAPALTPDRRTVIYSAHAIHADVWVAEDFDPRKR